MVVASRRAAALAAAFRAENEALLALVTAKGENDWTARWWRMIRSWETKVNVRRAPVRSVGGTGGLLAGWRQTSTGGLSSPAVSRCGRPRGKGQQDQDAAGRAGRPS